jgi:hypothetical protein
MVCLNTIGPFEIQVIVMMNQYGEQNIQLVALRATPVDNGRIH